MGERGRTHREQLALDGDLRGDVVLHLRLQLQLTLQQLARQRLSVYICLHTAMRVRMNES